MGKFTQLGDFENRNDYKTVILKIKIKIITNYEFIKKEIIKNEVILKIVSTITYRL